MSDRFAVSAGAPTILVADDDDGNRTLLRDLLETEGYHVVTAADGETALEIGRASGIDLAILDMRMPRATGVAVCQELKADHRMRLVPVLLISGLATADDRALGMEAGADDFVGKPFLRDDLLTRVRLLIRWKEYMSDIEGVGGAPIESPGRRPVQRAPLQRADEAGYAAVTWLLRRAENC